MCCFCDGNCNHVGPHARCADHGGTPYIVWTSTTTNVIKWS